MTDKSTIPSLNDFPGWEDNGAGESFFEVTPVKPVVETEKKEEVREKKEGEEEEEAPDPLFFDIPAEEGKEEKKKEAVIQEEEAPADFLGEVLKKKGLIKEGQTLDADNALDILEENLEEEVEAKVAALLKSLPKELQDVTRFVLDGGDFNQMLKALAKGATSTFQKGMSLTHATEQEAFLQQRLKEQGYDEDYISTQLEFLKEKGKLEDFTKKEYKLWEKEEDKRIQQDLTLQKEAAQKEKEDMKLYRNEVSQYIKDLSDIKGYILDDKTKKELPGFMSERIPTTDGRKLSQMQTRLIKALGDKTEAPLLAALLLNNFNFEKMINSAKKKEVEKLENNLQRKDGVLKSLKKVKDYEKSLSDYF